ncbi:MAG: polymer-forming cytoskeletal protein, partial [Anaerolineae bacterium]|nr:polymer-forming cytoskeletal protein [Anaerolineae bacterium]
MRRHNLKYLRSTSTVIVLVALLFATGPAYAAELDDGDTVKIERDETFTGDLLVNTGRLIIDGVLEGDVSGYAQRVEITGRVTGDINLVGHEMVLTGTAEDDIRAAFVSIQAGETARIGGDLTGAGFNLTLAGGGDVGGDVWYIGYQANLAGTVHGDVHFDGVALVLDGAVAGSVEARVESPGALKGWALKFGTDLPVEIQTPGLALGAGAAIAGDLSYTAPQSFNLPKERIKGYTAYHRSAGTWLAPALNRAYEAVDLVERQGWIGAAALLWMFTFITRLVTFLVFGLVVIWRAPRLLEAAAIQLHIHAVPSLALGILTAVLIPLAVVLAGVVVALAVLFLSLISLGGLSGPSMSVGALAFGALVTAIYLGVGFVAPLVIAYSFGDRLVKRINQHAAVNPVLVTVAGVALYICMWQIPVLGEFLNCLSVLFGVGALILYWRTRHRPAAPRAARALLAT